MTKIKLCGLTRPCDIEWANDLQPDYIGFVFAKKSKRYVAPERAKVLREGLASGIRVVGVFVNEAPEAVAARLNDGIIDIAQLHGSEDENYIRTLRKLTDRPLIKAFRIDSAADLARAVVQQDVVGAKGLRQALFPGRRSGAGQCRPGHQSRPSLRCGCFQRH